MAGTKRDVPPDVADEDGTEDGAGGGEAPGSIALNRGAAAERDSPSPSPSRGEQRPTAPLPRMPDLRQGSVTEARVAAAGICTDLRAGTLLDAAFDARTQRLEPRDRRWTRELVYGMLRRRAMLDALLGQRIKGGYARVDLDLLDLLRLGSYQLLHMDSVPPYAAIGQTVELAKRRHGIGASKLANAVLRRLDRDRVAGEATVPESRDVVDTLALALSHPRWLVKRWIERMGADETRALLLANNLEAPLIARPIHVVREQLEAMLENAGVHVGDAPLVRDSIRLIGPVSSLTEIGAFKKGLFHLQDPASTLVTMYASLPTDAVVVDLCAAPGGKSIELARTASRVYAADMSAGRIQRVIENIERMDLTNVIPVVADAMRPPFREVDAVLIDAPCTGTGTFRRHPDARWRIKPADLPLLSGIQRDILRAGAAIVRAGGLLVYSTCSLEPEENEAQVETFLRDHPEWRLDPPPAGVVPDAVLDNGMLRVVPHRHGADGSFAARFRRTS